VAIAASDVAFESVHQKRPLQLFANGARHHRDDAQSGRRDGPSTSHCLQRIHRHGVELRRPLLNRQQQQADGGKNQRRQQHAAHHLVQQRPRSQPDLCTSLAARLQEPKHESD
jgi:hypothetical protein